MKAVFLLRLASLASLILNEAIMFEPATAAAPVRTEKAACNQIRTRVAAVRHFRASVITYCDTIGSADSPKRFYVVALHSNRRCDGICSTNMGWFAIQKTTGRVFEWDVADMKLGRLIKP